MPTVPIAAGGNCKEYISLAQCQMVIIRRETKAMLFKIYSIACGEVFKESKFRKVILGW